MLKYRLNYFDVTSCKFFQIKTIMQASQKNLLFQCILILESMESPANYLLPYNIVSIINTMAWQNIQEYNQHFDQKSQEIKSGPVEGRSCTQWGCLIAFALIFLATFGGGAYFIYQGKGLIGTMIIQTQSATSTSGFGYVMAKLAGPIVGMLVLACGLSVLLIVLGKTFPRQTMYFLIGFTFLVYIALIILGFVINNFGLAISFIIIALLTACMLYCFWSYINTGLKLLQCAARFITQKPAVYFISLMCLILNAAFIVFWVFAWLGVYSVGTANNDTAFQVLTFVWYVDLIFWGFFLYYCMVFLIASACAYWYYQSQNNSVLRGINNIKYHLGSICFGSIVITIITALRIIATAKKSQGSLRFIALIAECLIRCVEDYIKVLNNNAIIVMSVTGEGYIDSAKSAISLIFSNFPLFIIIDYFSSFYDLFAAVFIGLVPALIGAGIIYQVQTTAVNAEAASYALWGGIIIFVLSLAITSVVIGMLNQALSCIFIFYCFDKKFRSMGMKANNIPQEIHDIFNDGSANPEAQQATMNYLNSSHN